MSDKKLTDNEITKAFEYWKKFNGEIDALIKICPEDKEMLLEQREILKITFEVFDLINRQKAEIERLHKEVGYWEAETKEARADIDKAVSEAVKEFAERLKENLIGWDTDPTDEEIEYTINNLVKEMFSE